MRNGISTVHVARDRGCSLLVAHWQCSGSRFIIGVLSYWNNSMNSYRLSFIHSLAFISIHFILFYPFVYPVCISITSMSLGITIPWTGTSQLSIASRFNFGTQSTCPVRVRVRGRGRGRVQYTIHNTQYTHLRLPTERSLSLSSHRIAVARRFLTSRYFYFSRTSINKYVDIYTLYHPHLYLFILVSRCS